MISYMTLKLRTVETFELSYFRDLLSKHRGVVTEAAKEAKMDRANFHRALKRLSIEAKKYRVKNEKPVRQTEEY